MSTSSEASNESTSFIRGIDLTWIDSQPLIYAAVFCSVLSCFISFLDLRDHLSRFDYPKIQVLTMRVLAMIPVFAVLTAGSMLYPKWRFFFTTLRDTYESFILYMFFMLMIAYLGGEGQLLRSLKRKRYKGVHLFPMCWLPTFDLDTAFYLRCKRWVLQCALIKPVTSFIALVGSPLGIYNEGNFALGNVYTYTCIILNISLTYALYYLVLFEVELEKELFYAQTFLKFLCVKSIVFFSYWQSVCVTILVFFHVFNLGENSEEKERISALLQDLLMCFELLPVAFLHRRAFGREKLDKEMSCVPVYMKEDKENDLRSNVDTALSINDVVEDTIGTIFYRRGKLVDQENAENDDDVDFTAYYDEGKGNIVAFTQEPTLDDLVKHAVASDIGVRVDGIVHFDEDSDREEQIQEMNFKDTDVILWEAKRNAKTEDTGIRVDTELIRASHQLDFAPHAYCVVCGRFDREMVKRRNGYKCRECVGTKSQTILRERQTEGET